MKHLWCIFCLLLFATSAIAQTEKPVLISWTPESDCAKDTIGAGEHPVCDSVISDGALVRSISYNGIYLAVSFVDDGKYVVADIFVSNDSGGRILVDPQNWIIAHYGSQDDFLTSKPAILKAYAVPPLKIANKVASRVRWANALSAFAASMSTTTTTGTASGTVRDNQGNSGTYTSRTESIGPDYAAQNRAAVGNAERSRSAAQRADNIMSTALLPNTVLDKSKMSGLVYFERSKKAKYGIVCFVINKVGYFFDWHVK